MPMFPELDSMIVVCGVIAPLLMARLMMLMAGRSLMLPPGLKPSSFAYRLKGMSLKTLSSLMSGVLPIVDKMPRSIIPPRVLLWFVARELLCGFSDAKSLLAGCKNDFFVAEESFRGEAAT